MGQHQIVSILLSDDITLFIKRLSVLNISLYFMISETSSVNGVLKSKNSCFQLDVRKLNIKKPYSKKIKKELTYCNLIVNTLL